MSVDIVGYEKGFLVSDHIIGQAAAPDVSRRALDKSIVVDNDREPDLADPFLVKCNEEIGGVDQLAGVLVCKFADLLNSCLCGENERHLIENV